MTEPADRPDQESAGGTMEQADTEDDPTVARSWTRERLEKETRALRPQGTLKRWAGIVRMRKAQRSLLGGGQGKPFGWCLVPCRVAERTLVSQDQQGMPKDPRAIQSSLGDVDTLAQLMRLPAFNQDCFSELIA